MNNRVFAMTRPSQLYWKPIDLKVLMMNTRESLGRN